MRPGTIEPTAGEKDTRSLDDDRAEKSSRDDGDREAINRPARWSPRRRRSPEGGVPWESSLKTVAGPGKPEHAFHTLTDHDIPEEERDSGDPSFGHARTQREARAPQRGRDRELGASRPRELTLRGRRMAPHLLPRAAVL